MDDTKDKLIFYVYKKKKFQINFLNTKAVGRVDYLDTLVQSKSASHIKIFMRLSAVQIIKKKKCNLDKRGMYKKKSFFF